MSGKAAVIIVTHNSATVLDRCIDSLGRQTRQPAQIVLVDSGSKNTAYLDKYAETEGYEVVRTENVGFSAANNIGLGRVMDRNDFVLFLNPDAFPQSTALQQCHDFLNSQPLVGACSGILQGFDVERDRPTGHLDSTGIFRTWYGRWYDRGQGQTDESGITQVENVPALCGAFLFCRTAALTSIVPKGFDESFFMYKEDVDLCLRLRKRGWQIVFNPAIVSYHCRGWQKRRSTISRKLRLEAARSDILLNARHKSPYILFALIKYLLVRIGDV